MPCLLSRSCMVLSLGGETVLVWRALGDGPAAGRAGLRVVVVLAAQRALPRAAGQGRGLLLLGLLPLLHRERLVELRPALLLQA